MTLYQEVRAALRESAFRPKKRLGQNFLIHENVIDSILRLLDLDRSDGVVEIGPGLGFLTRRLLQQAGQVWAVEVDNALVASLRQTGWAIDPRLHLIHGDVLAVPLGQILPNSKFKLVGNLPYSISTPVLFRIFDWHVHFSNLVLMVQREVADRIAGMPGTKDYGTVSVWCQLYGRISERISVSPEAFFPRPKVRSTVLKIELFAEPLVGAGELPYLRGLVRAAFGQRRKTLSNTLIGWLERPRLEIDQLLLSCDIDPRRRGETLSVDEFVRLAGALSQRILPSTDN